MKLCRCPICHSDLTLEALMEDEAGRVLLNKILNMGYGCGSAVVGYLGLFKPAKSTLSNSRAVRILDGLLELYDCSHLLAHALSETVEQVRKNRREGGRCEPLSNHNYLKKVYESCRPQFAPSNQGRRVDKAPQYDSQEKQARGAEEKRLNNIGYIDRLVKLKGVEGCRGLHGFEDWQKWQEEKQNVRTNP
ncbi:hypothetical protein A4G19_03640 [Pasteurellaceae bacterium Macca]|nr:hypothetical protein [Pasteurellaceae bacterium Macca]